MTADGAVTPDGYAVNTLEPISPPHSPDMPDRLRLPLQTMRTIGRSLTDAGVSWAWYAGGYADAFGGHPDRTFIYHHQPFMYFGDYADGYGRTSRTSQGRTRYDLCDQGSNPSRGQLL